LQRLVCLLRGAAVWSSQVPPMPPPTCAQATEVTSWRRPWTPRSPPLLSPLSLAHSLSFPCATSQTPSTPPWPSSSAAARSRPLLRRRALELRHPALFLPANRIDSGCPELPPFAVVSPQVPESAAAEIRHRRLASGQADLPGELLVSSWSGLALFPLVSHAGALSPAGCHRRQ
jgi:hypothetical protein